MNITVDNSRLVKAFTLNTYYKLLFESKMSHSQAIDSIQSRLYNRYNIVSTSNDIEFYVNQVIF